MTAHPDPFQDPRRRPGPRRAGGDEIQRALKQPEADRPERQSLTMSSHHRIERHGDPRAGEGRNDLEEPAREDPVLMCGDLDEIVRTGQDGVQQSGAEQAGHGRRDEQRSGHARGQGVRPGRLASGRRPQPGVSQHLRGAHGPHLHGRTMADDS